MGEKTTLFSFICRAATKESETKRTQLPIVSSSIGDFNRGGCEDAIRIDKVQAALLDGAQALAGIKADHHAAWQGQRERDAQRASATPCHTRPSKPALIRHLGQDPPMPPTPSPTYERLRDYIAKRMRMSP